jgi:two-component sensor histidine kinase/CHASE3 domain sensor protein
MTARFSILNVLLILSLLALVACVVTIMLAARAELRFREQERLSAQIIEALDNVIVSSLEAESGQRGYLLTGDKGYFAPYETAIGKFRASLQPVAQLLEGRMEAPQTAALADLQKWAGVKVVELSSTTELFREGNVSSAMKLVRTDTGVTAMDQIRYSTGLLIDAERRLIAVAQSEARRSRLVVLACVITLAFLSLFGFALALRNLQRSQKLGIVEQHARQLANERERTDLLARELNHRVKNLFAIVQSIISSTARQETDARVAATKIRERVYALSRAHSLTSSIDMQQQTTLEALVNAIVASQVSEHCDLKTDGPPVTVMAQHVTPLGMILHELTTNAVKYGAGACDGGRIEVTWTIQPEEAGKELKINWKEICAPDANLGSPGPDGFGSRMMTISLSQLGGFSEKIWTEQGLNMNIQLPLDDHGAVKDRNK